MPNLVKHLPTIGMLAAEFERKHYDSMERVKASAPFYEALRDYVDRTTPPCSVDMRMDQFGMCINLWLMPAPNVSWSSIKSWVLGVGRTLVDLGHREKGDCDPSMSYGGWACSVHAIYRTKSQDIKVSVIVRIDIPETGLPGLSVEGRERVTTETTTDWIIVETQHGTTGIKEEAHRELQGTEADRGSN